MLNKSDILQRVLKLVDEYRRADNKKAISSDYFMAVFLRLLSIRREDTLPFEFKNEEALGRPFRRFDMSEYADKEANIMFCGSDSSEKKHGGNAPKDTSGKL